MDAPPPLPAAADRALPCPTCGAALQSGQLHEVPIGRCASCDGFLVIQHDLVRLLGALSPDLSPRCDLDAPVAKVTPLDAPLDCPRCQGSMDRFGYLGASAVQPHVCGSCGLLWLTAAELEGTWRLHARTERQDNLMERELADIQTASINAFVGLSQPPPGGRIYGDRPEEPGAGDVVRQLAHRIFGPTPAVLLFDALVLGAGEIGKLPLPDWLRLAEPPKPPK